MVLFNVSTAELNIITETAKGKALTCYIQGRRGCTVLKNISIRISIIKTLIIRIDIQRNIYHKHIIMLVQNDLIFNY